MPECIVNPDRTAAQKTFRSGKREALTVTVIVVLALVWTVGYCALRGYQHPADSWLVKQGIARNRTPDALSTFAGVPDWVFFGIALPWGLCTVATIIFSLRGMADDDLGQEQSGEDAHAP